MVANGGLGNGVSREELCAALKEMGELETLIMPPHKPYAFVTYRYSCCIDSSIAPGCYFKLFKKSLEDFGLHLTLLLLTLSLQM